MNFPLLNAFWQSCLNSILHLEIDLRIPLFWKKFASKINSKFIKKKMGNMNRAAIGKSEFDNLWDQLDTEKRGE